MLELNQCYNMDCMKGMAQFPDGFFDLAVVDPPYFSGPERRGYYGSKVSKIGVYRDYPVSPVWEIPGRAYFDELRRVAKHYIVWGCNYFSYEFAPGRIVWDKCKKGTSFSDCELAATDLFNTVRLFRFMWNGMLQGKSVAEGHIMQGNKKLNEQRIHPTQKPVALYDWIFQNYAAPGCALCRSSFRPWVSALHIATPVTWAYSRAKLALSSLMPRPSNTFCLKASYSSSMFR